MAERVRLLVGHLLVGILAGLFAAAVSPPMGSSPGVVAGCCILRASIGLVASAVVAGLSGAARARGARKGPGRGMRAALGLLLMTLLGFMALGWSLAR